MQLVGNFLKWVIGLGLVGFIAWFIYQKVNSGPPTKEEVKQIAIDLGAVIGDEKTELSQPDRTTIEYEIGKLEKFPAETILEGVCLLDPATTEGQYLGVELILRRMYEGLPANFTTRLSDDPWEVSGESAKLSPFSIDRTASNEKPSAINLTMGFDKKLPLREPWATKLESPAPKEAQ